MDGKVSIEAAVSVLAVNYREVASALVEADRPVPVPACTDDRGLVANALAVGG